MQICLSFIGRQGSFLAEETWKTVPWTVMPKSFQDKLLDITVEIPAIAEATADPSCTWTRRVSLQLKVLRLVAQLGSWWTDWNVANPRSAYEVEGGLNVSRVRDPHMLQMLLKTIRFESATHAIEMLCYNAALVYLMELATTLSEPGYTRATPTPQLPKAFPTVQDDDGTLTPPPASPLTPPGLVRRLSQPAVEALRIIPFLAQEAAVNTSPTLMPIWPLGILYFTWKRMPELRSCLDTLLKDFKYFQNTETELAGMKVPGGNARYATIVV
jgi:hypothetical protein